MAKLMMKPLEGVLAGVCGDWCGKCPNFGLTCQGCTEHSECDFYRCCVLNKGLEHCGLCPDFPCLKLSEFVPDDRPGCTPGYHIDALKRRVEVGTEAWLAEQCAYWRGRGLVNLLRAQGVYIETSDCKE